MLCRFRGEGLREPGPSLRLVADRLIAEYADETGPLLVPPPPFELLVSTVVSQATERRNTRRAVAGLRRLSALTPAGLLALDRHPLEEALRPAGLFRNRARTLAAIAAALDDDGLERIMKAPLTEARRELIALPGVGPKTADVFLAFTRKGAVFPVDVHIARILKRLPACDGKAGYEEMRRTVEESIGAGERNALHLSLIEHGRGVCRPRPRCVTCVLRDECRRVGVAATASS